MSSPGKAANCRLLYRGALTLPDSHICLDGLTFLARTAGNKIQDIPLALDLESMRGRSLRFMGTASLEDTFIDHSGNVTMEIHPQAMMSRIYFENTFCLLPHRKIGVRVALGDTDTPETTYMMIYAQYPDPSLDKDQLQPIVLSVGRITTAPAPKLRLPRPDDPKPRLPPSLVKSRLEGPQAKRRKLQREASAIAATLGSGVRLGQPPPASEAIFMVPDLPVHTTVAKSKKHAVVDEDIFGPLQPPISASKRPDITNNKKRKQDSISQTAPKEAPTLERTNRDVIKQAAFDQLKNIQFTKAHPEWKEVFNMTYYGVAFALRHMLKITPLIPEEVSALVKLHINMYAPRPTT